MKRLLLGVACIVAGSLVGAVRIGRVFLERIDEGDRGGQVVPIRIRSNESLMDTTP